MKNTILKALMLFVSIPLINAMAFGVGNLFHDLSQSTISAEQYISYEMAMNIMIWASGFSVFIIEGLYDQFMIKNSVANLLYIIVFAIVAFSTSDQFVFRPYEHSLTFLSMMSVLASRIVLNKKLMPGRLVEGE